MAQTLCDLFLSGDLTCQAGVWGKDHALTPRGLTLKYLEILRNSA